MVEGRLGRTGWSVGTQEAVEADIGYSVFWEEGTGFGPAGQCKGTGLFGGGHEVWGQGRFAIDPQHPTSFLRLFRSDPIRWEGPLRTSASASTTPRMP